MQTPKFQVLQLVGNLNIGGAQEVVRTLVAYLALSGECEPIVCTFADGPLRHEIEQLGVKVEVLPTRRYSIIAFPLFVMEMIQIWQKLVRLVKRYDIDVVQTHLGTLSFLALLLLYTSKVRGVLWTFHSASFELKEVHLPSHKWLLKPKRQAHLLLYRLTAPFVSGFVAVSDEVKKVILKLIGPFEDKITVICNGVDVKRYEQTIDRAIVRSQLGLDENAQLIIQVGTLKQEKGHRYLIEAVASIIPNFPNLHILFVGDVLASQSDEFKKELQAQVRALNLDQNIHFLGNRQDVPQLLAASDLFVLPSLWEGLPMALLEAMATGLPVVASEVSGTIQVMIPNETGLLSPPGDVQRLREAIEQLLSNPVQALAMGQAAKCRVEARFSAQKQANEHLALYRRLLKKSAVSRQGGVGWKAG